MTAWVVYKAPDGEVGYLHGVDLRRAVQMCVNRGVIAVDVCDRREIAEHRADNLRAKFAEVEHG